MDIMTLVDLIQWPVKFTLPVKFPIIGTRTIVITITRQNFLDAIGAK